MITPIQSCRESRELKDTLQQFKTPLNLIVEKFLENARAFFEGQSIPRKLLNCIVIEVNIFNQRIQRFFSKCLLKKPNYLIHPTANRIALSEFKKCYQTQLYPISKDAFGELAKKGGLALTHDISSSLYRGNLCVGMSLSFLQKLNKNQTFRESITTASKPLTDGADFNAILLQNLYETLLASNQKIETDIIEQLKPWMLKYKNEPYPKEPLRHYLIKNNTPLSPSLYTAILDLDIQNEGSDHSLRDIARKSVAELLNLRLKKTYYNSNPSYEQTIETLANLSKGSFIAFVKNHTFVICSDEKNSYIFDPDQGVFETDSKAKLIEVLRSIVRNDSHSLTLYKVREN